LRDPKNIRNKDLF